MLGNRSMGQELVACPCAARFWSLTARVYRSRVVPMLECRSSSLCTFTFSLIQQNS